MILLLFFIIGLVFLSCFNYSLIILGKFKKEFPFSPKNDSNKLITSFLQFFIKKSPEMLYLIINITKHILVILYSITFLYVITNYTKNFFQILGGIILIIIFSLSINLFAKYFSNLFSKKIIYLSSLIACFYIYPLLPVTFLFLKISKKLSHPRSQKIFDLLCDINTKEFIDPKILNFLISFQQKESGSATRPPAASS